MGKCAAGERGRQHVDQTDEQRVTGLTTEDFERLVSLGVFNSALMNDAVWKFRRYEDASLRYMGVSRHKGMDVGLYDTALTAEDFKATFEALAKE